ncbi:MAG: ribosome-associated translation inhibitor RaiA [Planctomycetales bacterium]|nr:ribosome-associated translation inhibitor RaiA [Planctomycetales bacterium]
MQINITTRHGHLSADSQDKIRGKAEKLTRLFERLTAVNVICDVEHSDNPSVEIRVSAELHDDFVATSNGANLMGAIDAAVHKLEQQLRKHKEKLKGHRTPGHRHEELSEPTSDAGE